MGWRADEFRNIRGIKTASEENKRIKTVQDARELLKEISSVCSGETQIDVCGDTEALQWIAEKIDEAL